MPKRALTTKSDLIVQKSPDFLHLRAETNTQMFGIENMVEKLFSRSKLGGTNVRIMCRVLVTGVLMPKGIATDKSIENLEKFYSSWLKMLKTFNINPPQDLKTPIIEETKENVKDCAQMENEQRVIPNETVEQLPPTDREASSSKAKTRDEKLATERIHQNQDNSFLICILLLVLIFVSYLNLRAVYTLVAAMNKITILMKQN